MKIKKYEVKYFVDDNNPLRQKSVIYEVDGENTRHSEDVKKLFAEQYPGYEIASLWAEPY